MNREVCIFFADGFEEIEGLSVVDLLRRAGVRVRMISVTGSLNIHGAHGINVQAEELFEHAIFEDTTMLVLPGGMPGTKHLKEHKGLMDLLEEFHIQQKYIAAICAAPSILGEKGYLKGKVATSYPSVEEQLEGAVITRDEVVVSDHIITSRGMGTAIAFSLVLIKEMLGQEKADMVASSILYQK
ncbi:DJ-1 family glyoxalase III [Lachnospiraceae bacterium LCP25S3_G4]